MRMGLELEPSRLPCALDKPGKARRGERRAALRCEYEGRLGLLLALQLAKGAQFVALDRMRAGSAALDPADGQGGPVEVDLIPAEINQLARAEAVAIGPAGSL